MEAQGPARSEPIAAAATNGVDAATRLGFEPWKAKAAARRHVILFLAANPSGTDRLALDREARSIHAELKRTGYRDHFEFVTRWATEPLDLLRELRELRPTVVHFSGHGRQSRTPSAAGSATARDVVSASTSDELQGLVFQDAAGNPRMITPAAIAEAFGAAGTSVKLVVLNACFSERIAEALLAHVDCVVGMTGAIHKDAARVFAIGFYGGLGEHESVFAAYAHGRAAIHLEGLPDTARPQLKSRDGCNATAIIPAAVAPVLRQALPCPYPGMRPYTAEDADRFHGRAQEIRELLGRLRAGEREIYVIGPSGSGKSSLVMAGTLRSLARGASGLAPFVVRDLRPGEQPATRLAALLGALPGESWVAVDCIAALLAHRAPHSSVLLVVDQLEELFTLSSAEERTRFMSALLDLRKHPRCVVIFMLRADFFGALMESPLWTGHPGEPSLLKVSPLHGDRLRDAIVSPARNLGVVVEPELVERLLADAAAEPGILPLLQETMVQLWGQRQDQTLTLEDYQAVGDGHRSGLAVALAHRADAALRQLTPEQNAIARRILLRLVSYGEGRSDTRRQQPYARLVNAGDKATEVATVLQRLIEHRLLTSEGSDDGDRWIDLGHEILISAWPVFADWIRAHRRDEQRRRGLEEAAARYNNGSRGLLDAIELVKAEGWQQTQFAIEIGRDNQVTQFIEASREMHNQQRWRHRLLVSAVTLLGLVAVTVAAVALVPRDHANETRRPIHSAQEEKLGVDTRESTNRELVMQSYVEAGRQHLLCERFQEAVPYLLAAREKGNDTAMLRTMFCEAKRHLPLTPPLEHQGPVRSAAFNPDGTRVVTASEDNTARVWDTATAEPITPPLEHHDRVVGAEFSADGTRVVTASSDGTARVWDAVTGKPVTRPLEHQSTVRSAAFSPDGTRVVTASSDGTARVWDAATGKPVTRALEHRDQVMSAAFSANGTRVVTASGDKTARVWDASTGKPLTAPLVHGASVWTAAFSPDGTRIVTASDDKTAQVWDAASGEPVTKPLKHQATVWSAAFNSDGTRVVTASEDNTARVWNAATGDPATDPLEHQATVRSAAFSPDGTHVVTASWDKTARVWDAKTGKSLTRPLEHQAAVWSAAFSPDGTHVVTASLDKTARIWDGAASERLTSQLQHHDVVWSAAFSPDGTHVVTASGDFTAQVWDAETGKPVASHPLQHQAGVSSAVFSPDGTRVVTASSDKTARVWDAETGKQLGSPLKHHGIVASAAFSPDGTLVVTASDDNTARVWDARTGSPLTGPLEHQGRVTRAAFSPDGTRVVTASGDNTARVWDAKAGTPVTSPLEHQARVASAAFSPDGTRVVTASDDNTARVWDAVTGNPVTRPLEHQGRVASAAFSPDGRRVVTASEDETARVWDAATGAPLTRALEHQATVVSAAFSPGGTRIVTASKDNTARVWDAATGVLLTSALVHQAPVSSAAFSPNGTRVVTASSDYTVRIWDICLDTGALDQWQSVAARSPFVLGASGEGVRVEGHRMR